MPQTAAVYAVAAWAAIQFADVIVPNLGWPQWVVTAVIIASGLGFPVVLVLAWFLEWGPEGIHRTDAPEPDPTGAPATGDGHARRPAREGPSRTAWMATISVLAVGILAAVIVVLAVGGPDGAAGGTDGAAPAAAAEDGPAPTRFERRRPAGSTDIPQVPDLDEIMSHAYGDSVTRAINDSIALQFREGQDLRELVEMASRIGAAFGTTEAGPVVIAQPRAWQFGAPHPVRMGDTLRVRGVARSEAGVVSVELAGRVVARADDPGSELPFEGAWVAGQTSGPLQIPVVVRTADGGELVEEFPVTVVPRRQED